MTSGVRSGGRLPAAFLTTGTASFTEFLAEHDPALLPGSRTQAAGGRGTEIGTPHGTTIVAVTYPGGAVMAGDRRATMGNVIASRDIQKVYPADESSCVGIAGTAGLAIELVKLFQVELEHYEKIEGAVLSVEGKANRLATMIRGNLAMAFQGLAVVPLFAGYDDTRDAGRIFSYDVTGGRYEEHAYHAVGSGSVYARNALKKTYRDDFDSTAAVMACLEALYDAAEDDSATGGPDLARRIFPVVAVVDANGYRRLDDDELGRLVQLVVDTRMNRPDGPAAALPGGEGESS